MGLYPRKGALAVGSDADIVVLDARRPKVIRKEDLHETDYTPWEGHEVTAMAEHDNPARQGWSSMAAISWPRQVTASFCRAKYRTMSDRVRRCEAVWIKCRAGAGGGGAVPQIG